MAKKDVCRRGHDLLTAENIYTAPSGIRQCKLCRREQHKAYRKTSKGKVAAKSRDIRESGWTLELYDSTLSAQDNACAVCRSAFSSFPKSPACDHDHETMGPRGLLCNGCNTGLGMFKDSPALLELAAQYLRKYGK